MSKYLLLTTRHSSIYGDEWALFWGYRESKNGYSADLRTAHRFEEEEIEKYRGRKDDIPISIDALGISEGYEDEKTFNKNIRVMIEKGVLNKLLDLELRPEEKEDEEYCPYCEEEL